jgi:ATP-binding protein involved in chromosome partitioning
MGIQFLGSVPVDPELSALCDKGEIERYDKNYVDECAGILENKLKSDG